MLRSIYDIPLATLALRPDTGQRSPATDPAVVGGPRRLMTVMEWVAWRMNKKAEDAQRRELGLPKATSPSLRRITERGSLEIQGYDELCFPGLGRRMGEMEWTTALCRRAHHGADHGRR